MHKQKNIYPTKLFYIHSHEVLKFQFLLESLVICLAIAALYTDNLI
ncbi:unnamed protein product [Spodoptera exigua]|nr:unnamed protein product [Spodoptera exigua]